MNKKTSLFVFLVLTILSVTMSKAQTTEEITNNFFKTYEDNPLEAVDYIFETNKWLINLNKDGIENVKDQLTGLIEQVGVYYGYEKITEKSVGESYKLVSYMVKYERQPIRFTFLFYMPNDKWQLQSFQYDDDLDEELETAANVSRLKGNME